MDYVVKKEYYADVLDPEPCRCNISLEVDGISESASYLLELLNHRYNNAKTVNFEMEISSVSWDDLSREVDKTIGSVTNQLKKLKKRVESLSVNRPEDERYKITI